MAPADHGFVNRVADLGARGVPGTRLVGSSGALSSVGESMGEEKERR